MADIKNEVKAEIKSESPRLGTPADEEDLYEDAGDLDFYDKSNSFLEKLYLARVPNYMWEGWMKMVQRLGDNDEIQIGTVRTWNQLDAQGENETKLRMLLGSTIPEHQIIPKEYDMEITHHGVENHFVFSEEDLPGFKARNKARQEAVAAGIPTSLLKPKSGGVERPTYDRKSRYQPYYRKAIPKKTRVFGKICYDVRVDPRNKQEEQSLLAKRLFDIENNRTKMKIIGKKGAASVITAGSGSGVQWQNNFIKNVAPTTKPKKGEHVRATRLERNAALDLIFACFREYQYWSMKALRQRTQQPDQYLRQLLEDVGVLIKSGPFANHYALSDAYKDSNPNDYKNAVAEAVEGGDDDDENEEMEDVL